ncbi:hypothetical protein BGZ95_002092 [Linnemannia exigua]|uniref:Uncharacterized protein n=1 Tax=Linnemannia exigua TaxID=604196 RepID=A0AAD4H379_9FUNG|nr:hypothetical protein BGZ95_002092 [Linnemannia exigua]
MKREADILNAVRIGGDSAWWGRCWSCFGIADRSRRYSAVVGWTRRGTEIAAAGIGHEAAGFRGELRESGCSAARVHANVHSGTAHCNEEVTRNPGVAEEYDEFAEGSESDVGDDAVDIGNVAAVAADTMGMMGMGMMKMDYPPEESEDAEILEIFEELEIAGMPENLGKLEDEAPGRFDDPDDLDDPESPEIPDCPEHAAVRERLENFEEPGGCEYPEKYSGGSEDSEEGVKTGSGGGQEH